MDASWWPAIVAVVVLAVIAGLVDSFGRVRRAHRRPAGPEPGEVWWALVPYGNAGTADGEERPCLVLKTAGETVTVAWITAREDGGRPDRIPLPPGSAGAGEDRPAILETDELHEVALRDLRRSAGPVDPAVWDQVRHLSDI
ncbi:type II toxin-antitoxin system PemK/MazF family toxin [Streptomyces sp. NBC_01808]|uniref:type II toxin-antitoxin system PemK/MazF family toxin n=1 Tax=Streptomyces sp. NBC_01808 TaxID=2975947 RepID=UPI002DD8C5D4|nr:type II toxin-antitoxin system PemK/MazF family toxin [Streptomyces sp. NBC_01808]WSA38028.1 type II toxin-antitoxin system PemK/MazF family toxin [Streptomyces sp. NBC_01808]